MRRKTDYKCPYCENRLTQIDDELICLSCCSVFESWGYLDKYSEDYEEEKEEIPEITQIHKYITFVHKDWSTEDIEVFFAIELIASKKVVIAFEGEKKEYDAKGNVKIYIASLIRDADGEQMLGNLTEEELAMTKKAMDECTHGKRGYSDFYRLIPVIEGGDDE
ncbi:MAG: hypothetical protein J6Z43_06555 [Clostridiales bacterium]|nr:hypothetical protein [Clostridiales bacterium]